MDDVENLRKEVDMLKKQLGDPSESKDLVRAIKSLNQIFAEAHEDLKIDTHDAVLVGDKIDRIIGRLEKIEIQNEKIAKGIVAVADMIEELDISKPVLPRENIRKTMAKASPPPSVRSGTKPLPSYNLPKQEQQPKKGFMNFKM